MQRLIQGVLVGFIIGILIAPEKGIKTRKKFFKGVCNPGKDPAEMLSDVVVDVKDAAGEIGDNLKFKAKTVSMNLTKSNQQSGSKLADDPQDLKDSID